MKAGLTLPLALLLIWSGATLAQTLDGLSPVLETTCGTETGAAYGLCNAYCEAMNCDADIPAASETACSKVRSQFQQATGHDLPCEVSCPCAIPGTIFSQVLSGELPAVACIYTPFEGITDGVVVYYSIPGFAAFSVEINNDIWICGPDGYFLPLTPEQGQYCVRLLEQAANSQGVTCQKP